MKIALSLALLAARPALAQATWEPTKTIEIVVPFAPGGASDQMARTIQSIIQKNALTKQSVVVVNKPAAAGGEAIMEMRAASGDPHKLVTTSSAFVEVGTDANTVGNSIFDIWLMLAFGVVGYIFKKLDYPLATLVALALAFLLWGPVSAGLARLRRPKSVALHAK